uniref:Uncharacterized protein n=1 Tax=Schistocephalus solidus TaxID=70667 RepID=A0A0V0JAG9_SCHSO
MLRDVHVFCGADDLGVGQVFTYLNQRRHLNSTIYHVFTPGFCKQGPPLTIVAGSDKSDVSNPSLHDNLVCTCQLKTAVQLSTVGMYFWHVQLAELFVWTAVRTADHTKSSADKKYPGWQSNSQI